MIVRFGLLLLLVSTLAVPAAGRSTFHDFLVKDAVESSLGRERLLDVRFYMAGQAHPAVARELGVFKSNRTTNAVGKSDEEACQVAFLSALISLQERARSEGGDAVVDIRSVTKHRDLESATSFRCAAGNVVANVAVTGRVVKFGK
jgi:uncharacterized protein YbjQ (UPF0145 family)